MRKCKFITGTMSLSLAVIMSTTGVAQLNGQVEKEAYAHEAKTTSEEPVIEKSANEVNTLKATGIFEEVVTTSTTVESKAAAMEEMLIKEVAFFKNIGTESESKETVKKSSKKVDKKKTKKKNTKKKNKKSSDNLEYMGNYKITAYCACTYCCGKSNGITASGTKAKQGRTIAADTSVLPFGTQVVIDGHTYTVEDRGGAIDGKKIDVYFDSHSDALKWGVRYIDVYVQK